MFDWQKAAGVPKFDLCKQTIHRLPCSFYPQPILMDSHRCLLGVSPFYEHKMLGFIDLKCCFFHGPAKSSSHQLKSVVNIPGFTGFQHVSTIQPGSHPHHSTSFSYAAPRKEVQITTNTVVRGDIVVLGTGDVVPADCDPGRFLDDCNVYNSVYIYILYYTYIHMYIYYITVLYIYMSMYIIGACEYHRVISGYADFRQSRDPCRQTVQS